MCRAEVPIRQKASRPKVCVCVGGKQEFSWNIPIAQKEQKKAQVGGLLRPPGKEIVCKARKRWTQKLCWRREMCQRKHMCKGVQDQEAAKCRRETNPLPRQDRPDVGGRKYMKQCRALWWCKKSRRKKKDEEEACLAHKTSKLLRLKWSVWKVFSGILDPVHSLLVSNFRNERNLSAQSSAGRKWVMTCLSLYMARENCVWTCVFFSHQRQSGSRESLQPIFSLEIGKARLQSANCQKTLCKNRVEAETGN